MRVMGIRDHNNIGLSNIYDSMQRLIYTINGMIGMQQANKIQLWVNGVCMTTITEEDALSQIEGLKNSTKWYSYDEGHALHIENHKPYYALNEQEKKTIKRKVTCQHCGKKQFFRNEDRCRYCYNYNFQWNNA